MADDVILVTGAAGYIGSHTCVQLLDAGHRVLGVDNFANGSPVAGARIAEIAGAADRFEMVELDLLDRDALAGLPQWGDVRSVIHFAGLKAVGESVRIPVDYYHVNLGSTLSLVAAMQRHDVRELVFSSSATVYGEPEYVPLDERARRQALNPYGRTKLMIEDILFDLAASDPSWRIALLRYFNPTGAHKSGRIGEDPSGLPNNLMPFVMQVAVGRIPELVIHGNDYPTPDGTAIRDYIHVVDLADGHLAALDAIGSFDGCEAFNLGTGTGSSVLDVVHAASAAIGRDLPYSIGPRRAGDAAEAYADPSLAAQRLGWKATRTIEEMCEDHWRWQEQNPMGFAG